MLKSKIGIGCGIAAAMYVAQLTTGLNLNGSSLQVVNATDSCSTAAECEEQISSARSRISEAKADEEAARQDLAVVDNDLNDILDQIEEAEEAVTRLKRDIEGIEIRIAAQEEELAELDIQVGDLQEIIGQRMRVTQRMNNSNIILDVLSESENIVDLVRRVRVINHLSATDAELMEELNTLIERQQAILASLQEEQNTLSDKRDQLEIEMAVLEGYKAELEEKKEALAQEIKRNENIRLSEEEVIRIAEEQQKALSQSSVPPTVSAAGNSDMFIIPLPSGLVTCEWMCYTNHTGIDLSSSNRQSPILAAAAGVVVTSGWHNAYGNWVVITHNINGQTYSTLYAHMATTPMVSVGQTVSQGQQIGIMGSTGNSTGPHLHFEIHPGGFRWGGAVNPRNYIAFPSRW